MACSLGIYTKNTGQTMTDDQQPTYFQIAVLHMLHRQYELLLQIANNTGSTVEDLQALIQAHSTGEYQVPMKW